MLLFEYNANINSKLSFGSSQVVEFNFKHFHYLKSYTKMNNKLVQISNKQIKIGESSI